jgi:iron complex outermembrane receptor protein
MFSQLSREKKRMTKWMGGGVLLALALWGNPVLAQEKVEVMDEIAVTASRTETRVWNTPQSVTVITEKQIQASPFERIEDIIRQVPGVFNFRHFDLHTNGIVSPIEMRGVGKNRVLFLLDGVPLNDNFNNSIAWVAWGLINKDAIQRIEIVRGPMSALYGSEGLGGIIHVITKKPQGPRETSVTGKLGNGSTFGADGFYSQQIKNFGVLLAGGYERSHGFVMDWPVYSSYTRTRDSEVGKIFGKASYDFTTQSNLTFTGLYYSHLFGQGREYFYSPLALDQYNLTYTHKWDKVNIKAQMFLNRAHKTAHQDAASDNYTSVVREEKFPGPTTWGSDFQATALPFTWSTITAGVTYKNVTWYYNEDHFWKPSAYPRDSGAEGAQTFWSPFINADLRLFNDKLIINGGVRYDWISNAEGRSWDNKPEGALNPFNTGYPKTNWKNCSPKGGMVFHPDDKTAIRASGGTGFRAPSLFELYKIHSRSGGTYLRVANPDLKPERITSYDVGIERYFTDKLKARVTFYQSFAHDYIGEELTDSYTVTTGKGKNAKTTVYNQYQLKNISKVGIHGLETEVEWQARKDLTFFGNYTFNVSRVEADITQPDLKGNYLPNEPIHKIHAGIWYKNPQIINVYLLANYYIDMYYDTLNTYKTGGYFTMDASLSRQFFDRTTLTLDLENIFDRKYPLSLAADSTTIVPGRLILGKVKVNF